MVIEKSRLQFEATYEAEVSAGPCGTGHFDSALFTRQPGGDYVIGLVQAAWWGWKASREELVIDLPPLVDLPQGDGSGCDDADDWDIKMESAYAINGIRWACKNALESMGLKVKS